MLKAIQSAKKIPNLDGAANYALKIDKHLFNLDEVFGKKWDERARAEAKRIPLHMKKMRLGLRRTLSKPAQKKIDTTK